MDALTKRIFAEQKAARCASSSDESSDEREIENISPRKVVSNRTMRRYMDKVCPDAVEMQKGLTKGDTRLQWIPVAQFLLPLVSVRFVIILISTRSSYSTLTALQDT